MRSLYLIEVTQHGIKRYVGAAPARDLVKMAATPELQTPQEAQRPISPKRLSGIADFVAASGTLSTSIVIGTENDAIKVEPAKINGIPNLYKMDFPETEAEFEEFKESFFIMDGQHRLFSFLPDNCLLPSDEPFEMTFEMYIKPTLRERQLIFKNTNEKQEKVASNLLMWFRAQLNMLNQKEQAYHSVVSLLNTEPCSPLKGRIIMGAEKITGGFKGEQVITILHKSDIKNLNTPPLDDQKMLKLISEYLSGWEIAVGSKIADREKTLGAFAKVAGFRFMILMLPTFYNLAVQEKQSFSHEYIAKKIERLFSESGLVPRDLFDNSSDYYKSLGGNPFAGETPTTLLAKEWSHRLRSMTAGSYDPLA